MLVSHSSHEACLALSHWQPQAVESCVFIRVSPYFVALMDSLVNKALPGGKDRERSSLASASAKAQPIRLITSASLKEQNAWIEAV